MPGGLVAVEADVEAEADHIGVDLGTGATEPDVIRVDLRVAVAHVERDRAVRPRHFPLVAEPERVAVGVVAATREAGAAGMEIEQVGLWSGEPVPGPLGGWGEAQEHAQPPLFHVRRLDLARVGAIAEGLPPEGGEDN